MADDWAPGDLALCVRAEAPLIAGGVYIVASVIVAKPPYSDAGQIGLFLTAVKLPSLSGAANASRFRKIRPLTDEERDEFLADIKTPEPVQ